jgi:hypothetical protein
MRLQYCVIILRFFEYLIRDLALQLVVINCLLTRSFVYYVVRQPK